MSRKSITARAAALAAGVFVAAGTLSGVAAPTADAYVYYGAIAFAPNGAWGSSWSFPSRSTAEQIALSGCGYSSCKVLTSFTECGAVAYNGSAWQGGGGPTLAAAQADALIRLGSGYIAEWACN